MSDTISRAMAIDALFELYEYHRDIDPTEAADLVRQGIFLAEKKIEKLPSAQPEIIRCKDCKYFAGEGMYCVQDIIVQYDHFYCYYAERREDE